MLIVAVVAMLSGAWFIYTTLAAREAANSAAKAACARHDLQFLDGTVAFTRLRLTRDAHSAPFALRRVYAFDFSVDGMTRKRGFVVVDGQRVRGVELPHGDLR